MKKIILLASLILPMTLSAADYMILMGAGGDPVGNTTIFDNGLRNIATYLKNNPKVKVDVAFNGGHSTTEKILQEELPPGTPVTSFLESDYKNMIKKYMDKLTSGEIKSGDQLMIYIDSHGAEADSAYKTHKIATAKGSALDLNNLAGSELVDLDQLEGLKKLAAKVGVKMAIIDNSCHSGNTLALADENTCVLSATGPNHFGWNSWGNNFPTHMSPGKTLEDVFLETRKNEITPSFPMISSPEGLSINDELYEKITPFLYHYDPANDKLTPFLIENSSAQQLCLSNANFQSLMATIGKIEEIYTSTTKILWWSVTSKDVDFSELKNHLTRYKEIQDKIAATMNQMHFNVLNEDTDVLVTSNTPMNTTLTYKIKIKDLLYSNYEKLIETTSERLKQSTDAQEKKSLNETLEFYRAAKVKREALLSQRADLRDIQKKQSEINQSLADTNTIASDIAKEERKLFNSMYGKARKGNPDKSKNPCHNFRL